MEDVQWVEKFGGRSHTVHGVGFHNHLGLWNNEDENKGRWRSVIAGEDDIDTEFLSCDLNKAKDAHVKRILCHLAASIIQLEKLQTVHPFVQL